MLGNHSSLGELRLFDVNCLACVPGSHHNPGNTTWYNVVTCPYYHFFLHVFYSFIFLGIEQLMLVRTSRKFLVSRLTPDMENKLVFLTTKVSVKHPLYNLHLLYLTQYDFKSTLLLFRMQIQSYKNIVLL